MHNNFGSTSKQFNEKMRDCKFKICLALADAGVDVWLDMKTVNLSEDLSDVLSENALEAFKSQGYISKKKSQITQKIIDKTKGDIKTSVAHETGLTQNAVTQAHELIFETLNVDLKKQNIQQFLCGKFITKCSINQLHESFVGNQIPFVALKIMPVPIM